MNFRSVYLLLYYGFAKYLPVSFRFQPLGMIAKQIRGVICRHIFKHTGKNVNIERGASFGSGAELELGDNSGIGVNCQIPPNVKIGSDVMIGPDVIILGQNHKFDRLDIPMRLQGPMQSEPVVIEADVWIGARAIILPGIKISKGTIIGAGAVVTKDVHPFAICVGNPARVVRFRNETENRED